MGAPFTDIYEEHVWSVYGFFSYRGLAAQDAEDLTQLTFERALKSWDRFDSEQGHGGDLARLDRPQRLHRPPAPRGQSPDGERERGGSVGGSDLAPGAGG